MIDKLDQLFPQSKDWQGMVTFVSMCGQLIGYMSQHKEKEGAAAHAAAIDTLIELLKREKE